jgi:hypothetical protein
VIQPRVAVGADRIAESRHRRPACPAFLKPTFNPLAARGARPFALRHALQILEQRAGGGQVFVVAQPDLGQALVGCNSPATLVR